MFLKDLHKKFFFIRIVFLLLGSTLFGQQTICVGSIKNYWVDITENSGNGTTGSVYSWKVLETSFKGSINSTTASGNQISVNWGSTPLGNYTLQVIEANGSCNSTQQLKVSLSEISSSLQSAFQICPSGAPITIDAGGNASYTYTWTVPGGVVNPGNVSSISTSVPGNYSVTINNGICSQSFSTTLSVSNLPIISEVKEISDGTIEVIAIGGNLPLSYSVDGIYWQSSNVFNNLVSGKTYTIYVRNNIGCLGITKLFTIFFLPNVITPQADGYNDVLHLKGIENFPNAQLQVYDRYGQLIFDSNKEKTFNWNGYYIGRPVPTASYWYVLDLGNGREKKTGWILVKNRN